MLALKVFRPRPDQDARVYVLVAARTKSGTKRIKYFGGGSTSIAYGPVLREIRTISGSKLENIKLHENMSKEPVWSVPIDKHNELRNLLVTPLPGRPPAIAQGREIELVPDYILRVLKIKIPPIPTDVAEKLGDFYNMLHPYQRDGVKHVIQRCGRGLIADEMGLGKTFQGLGLLKYYGDARPAFIVCPAVVKASWVHHVHEHLDGEEARVIHKGTDDFGPGINVISYGMLGSKKFAAKLAAFEPKMGVVDESHYVKHATSGRTKKVFALCKKAKRVVLLTGTPMNRPVELFTQIRCIMPKLFPNFFHYQKYGHSMTGDITNKMDPKKFYFANRYCRPTTKIARGQFNFEFRGSSNEYELHAVLHLVMIRRTKDILGDKLPPKIREKIVIDEWEQEHPVDFSTDREFMDLVRDTAERKIPYVQKYLKDILMKELDNNPGTKVLLWAHHHIMLDAMEETMSPVYTTVRMDGNNPQYRTQFVKQFQEDPDCRVAVLGIKAMGTGVTMTAGTISVFAEACFTPDVHLQAEDRIHRLTQTRTTTVRYLLCEGSTDTIIMRMLDRKVQNSGKTVDGKIRYLRGNIKTTSQLRNNLRRNTEDDGPDMFDFANFAKRHA